MSQEEIAKNVSKILQTFNDKRVVTDEQIQEVLQAIVTILAENKKGIEGYAGELENQLKAIRKEHESVLLNVSKDTTKTKAEIEKAVKAQNDRAFKRLQEVLNKATSMMPKNGKDGKDGKDGLDGAPGRDGSPDTPEEVRDKLEALDGEERLDAKAIKNIDKYFAKVKGKTGEVIVTGIRFLEQLADVSIIHANKRQNLTVQYNTTNNRWEDGIAITVSATQPSSPKENDIWIDIS